MPTDKLRRLSQLTWAQIRLQDRHGLGTEKLAQDQVRCRIPTKLTSDTYLLAFRFSGMKSMVGYKDGAIFHIIAFDRNFTLYDH